MKILRLIILIMMLLPCSIIYGQDKPHFMNKEGYDSLKQKQGYWKEVTALNRRFKAKGFAGVEGWEYGYYINGKRIGGWDVKDDKGNLLGYRLYQNDTILFEIQYDRKGRVRNLNRKEIFPAEENDSGINSMAKFIEALIFDKRGRIKQRFYVKPNGEELYIEYDERR